MADLPADTLVQRLRACNVHRFGAAEKWADPRNPDGPEAADRIEALEAEVERLREALQPFAKAADVKLCGEWRNDQRFCETDVGFYLTFGDLRFARAALEGGKL